MTGGALHLGRYSRPQLAQAAGRAVRGEWGGSISEPAPRVPRGGRPKGVVRSPYPRRRQIFADVPASEQLCHSDRVTELPRGEGA